MKIKRYLLPILLTLVLLCSGIGFNASPTYAVGGMSQIIFGGYADPLNSTGAAVEYNLISGGGTWNSTLFNRSGIIASSGTIKNLYVELSAAVAGGGKYTFTLMYDGAASALTFDIATGASSGNSGATSINVVAGKAISLKCLTTATVTNTPNAQWSVMFTGTTTNESLIPGGIFLCSTSTTVYSPLISYKADVVYSTENECRSICPTGGNIKNLYVILNADPGDPAGPDSYRFTLRVNGASKTDAGTGNPLQSTIAANNVSGQDTTNTIAVSAGDVLDLMIEPLNTPSVAPIAEFGLTFVATTNGESIILGNSGGIVSGAGTRYHALNISLSAPSTTEAPVQQLGQVCVLKKLYVLLNGTPYQNSHSDDIYAFTVRNNSGSTAITCTVTSDATTANDTTHTATLAAGDNVDLMSVPTSTPTNRNAYWGLVCYIAPTVSNARSYGYIIW